MSQPGLRRLLLVHVSFSLSLSLSLSLSETQPQTCVVKKHRYFFILDMFNFVRIHISCVLILTLLNHLKKWGMSEEGIH